MLLFLNNFLSLFVYFYIYSFIIILMKKYSHTKKKARKRYTTEIFTDADYDNHLALLSNTSTQDESLLHRLEQAAEGIGLYVNSAKTEFLFLKNGVTSLLNNKPLKLLDHFTCLGSNISSTEGDVRICIGKAWAAIDWLSATWKNNPSDEIKQKFPQAVTWSILLSGCTHPWTLTKRLEKRQHRNYTAEQILEAAPHKNNSCTAIFLSSHKPSE